MSHHSRHLLLELDESVVAETENLLEEEDDGKTLMSGVGEEKKQISETELESSVGDTSSQIAITESIMSTIPIMEPSETQMEDDFAILGSNL